MLFDEALAHSVPGRLGAVGGVGLVQDASHMVADGIDADNQGFGDLSVGFAPGYQPYNLYFPWPSPAARNAG